MPTAKVSDIDMYYELHGDGEPIVLINGLGSDISDITPAIGCLSRKFKVLAFDNRGAGRTDKPDAPYTIEQMVGDATALMGLLDIGQAHVVGISMGGRIAMALALDHPEKVKSLVLTSTYARQTRMTLRRRLLSLVKRIPGIEARMSKYPQPYYAFERQQKASRSYDCSARLGEIQVPTLILHGRSDWIVPLPLAEEMHAGIRGSKMATFPGGHLFFMWRQEEFCDTIAGFLAVAGK